MLLLKNAELYTPERLGKKDVLIEGSRIALVSESLEDWARLPEVQVVDLEGRIAVPGYIDIHEHITGGGGEQGPASRCPEAPLSMLVSNGVTTAIGLLGTDGVTRSLENLLAKARAFCEEGVTCYMLSGSYGYPPVTLTGSVERDLVLIDLAVGVKTSLSDHRSPGITGDDLIRLGAEARRGGLLSGKAGIVTIHMGSGKAGLGPVLYAIARSDLPARTFLPTHMGRTEELCKEGLGLLALGGFLDFTAGLDEAEDRVAADRLSYLLDRGWEDQLTLSSDAFGSFPVFSPDGECSGLSFSTPSGIHRLLRLLVRERGESLERVLKLVTVNPARLYRLSKGCIAPGYDADIVVYDEDMGIYAVIAKGKLAAKEGRALIKGRFEP